MATAEAEMLVGRRRVIGRLVDARTKKGLTQLQVAEQLGTTQSAIARLEAARFDPKLSTVMNYARIVGAGISVTGPSEPQGRATTKKERP